MCGGYTREECVVILCYICLGSIDSPSSCCCRSEISIGRIARDHMSRYGDVLDSPVYEFVCDDTICRYDSSECCTISI